MTDTFRLNIALPSNKTADKNAFLTPGTQLGMADVNATWAAITDMRNAVRADEINAKNYGAKGDGVTTNTDAFAINAAISAAASSLVGGAFGGNVYLPRGVYIIDTKIRLSNGVGLRGDAAGGTWLVAAPGYSDTALIDNLNQDGTQEYAFIENLLIDGRKSTSTCSVAVVNLVSLFIHSYVKNCVILGGSSVGLRLAAAGTPGGAGPMLVQNVWVDGCTGHNVLAEEVAGNSGAVCGFYFDNLTSEHQGSGSSALYLKGLGKASGWQVTNFHTEMGNTATTRTGITIDGVSHVLINGVQILCDNTTVSSGIKITANSQNVDIQIRSVYNPNLCNPVIQDLQNSVTYGAVNVPRYVTADVTYDRLVVAPTGGTKSLSVRDSGGTERAFFNANGVLTGASVNGAGLDIQADVTNNRGWTVQTNAGGNVFEWVYPSGGGGVLRERYRTGNVDVRQIGTDGTQFFYQGLTCQGAVALQGNVGFFNHATAAKPTVTGSRGANVALASLLTGLAGLGLLTDSSTV